MIKIIKQISILVLLIFILMIPYFVFAEADAGVVPTTKSILEGIGDKSGYQVTGVNQFTAAEIAGTAVNIFLSILGMIFIALMLYGGYLWMMDRGNEENIKKAKDLIISAIIGLVIVIGSYAISYFVFSRITQGALTDTKGGGSSGSGGEVGCEPGFMLWGGECIQEP